MKKISQVRLGIIGVGWMGASYGRMIEGANLPNLKLVAVADPVADLSIFPHAKAFKDPQALIDSGEVDAVLIATPHYFHTTWGIAALRAGLHVLVDKPISVHKADALALIAAHQNSQQIFAGLFNQRTDPHYLKVRQLIQDGELGEIRRVQWTVTNWFRNQAYYDSAAWRGTWAGEGGGILMNQAQHNLDIFQWLFGMPTSARAFCRYGHYHNIEVEDDVTAYFEFANGSTGVFITSTGEAPGVNRLEIAAEYGRVEVTDGKILWQRNVKPMREFSNQSTDKYEQLESKAMEIRIDGHGAQHLGIIENFASAITQGVPLIAPAVEGLNSLELANAMLLSSHLEQTLKLPLDPSAYQSFLKNKIAGS